MGAFRGKFGSPQNRLQDGGILRIPRTSRISRKKLAIRGNLKFFFGGDFGFPGTGYLACEIFFAFPPNWRLGEIRLILLS